MFTTLIKSSYKSDCAKCGCIIPRDTLVYWNPKARKAYHLLCRPASNRHYRYTPDKIIYFGIDD